MKAKRKILSILLGVCLAFMLVPTTAFAAGEAAFEVIDTEGNTTQYATVQEARKAMKDGYTLKLLKDYVSTPDYNFGISIDGKIRGITIDLNGCNVTSNQNNGYALKLEQNYGGARDNTVTIKNSGNKQSVLASSGYQITTRSGDSQYTQIVNLEGDIAFQNVAEGVEPLGIKLGTGAKLLDTESARALISKGGFSVKEADGNAYIYGSCANAAGKSADGNITLLHDYEGNENISSGSKDAVLNLDGHTYTYTGNEAAIAVNYPNVTFTVKGGKVSAVGEATDGAHLIGAPNASNMNNRGLILEGVELTVAGDAYGIITNGTETGNRVTLKDSTLNVVNGVGIYFPSDGEVRIENSVINAKHTGVQLCAGNLTITGETAITVTGQPQEKTDGDGAITDGAAVSIVNRDGYKKLGTVNIENGVFNSAADVEAVKAYSFNNTDKIEGEWPEAGTVVEVTGGSFSSDIAEDIINSDMQATITSKGETRFVIGKTVIEQAVKALEEGDKITFTKAADDTKITFPEGVEITNSTGKDMTVNGDTIEGGETATVHVWDTKYTIDKEATCTENGSKSIHCTDPNCTEKKDVQIIPAAHKLENVAAQEATCKTEGIKAHQHCTACGKNFLNGEEVTADELKIAKLAHAYTDGKCTVCGAADPNYDPESSTPSKLNDNKNIPQTGDNSKTALWLAVMLASGAALICAAFYSRKKKYNQ
ncbi:hypothetical protein OCV51_06155 [Faecalicatena acetigenes]|uniref:Gram-positive cocci surface proteins LPxTG domain-containing protein n=1 Tax=Faecalicatena acetigenes TaxID=2981790 RepID=A0ABT2TBI3_9FIRM|nr:hypothetical protein [Faecalicatena acetigenes]MCU6747237.1 hypothetical protein [Faecalicatena acetigenes]SCH75338.1 Uncharacterised protein [uncultured Clostridium sp.]